MSPRAAGAIVLGLWIGVCGDASAAELIERREPCADSSPLRKPYFGDLHVHTTFSLDASTQGTRNRPHDAYRFARGARLEVQPYDSLGKGLRTIQLARPLDFAAVAPCGPIPTLLRSDASQDGSGARVELTDLVHAR